MNNTFLVKNKRIFSLSKKGKNYLRILRITQSTEKGIANWGKLHILNQKGGIVRTFPLSDDWSSENYKSILC